ncbi:hypothetical protein GCM10027214_14550 [Stenotrophomonas tumulicola]
MELPESGCQSRLALRASTVIVRRGRVGVHEENLILPYQLTIHGQPQDIGKRSHQALTMKLPALIRWSHASRRTLRVTMSLDSERLLPRNDDNSELIWRLADDLLGDGQLAWHGH